MTFLPKICRCWHWWQEFRLFATRMLDIELVHNSEYALQWDRDHLICYSLTQGSQGQSSWLFLRRADRPWRPTTTDIKGDRKKISTIWFKSILKAISGNGTQFDQSKISKGPIENELAMTIVFPIPEGAVLEGNYLLSVYTVGRSWSIFFVGPNAPRSTIRAQTTIFQFAVWKTIAKMRSDVYDRPTGRDTTIKNIISRANKRERFLNLDPENQGSLCIYKRILNLLLYILAQSHFTLAHQFIKVALRLLSHPVIEWHSGITAQKF